MGTFQTPKETSLDRYGPNDFYRRCNRSLTRLLRLLNRDVQEDGEVKWSMSHGFYAGMGGFVFDVDHSMFQQPSASVPRKRRLTLTARGVLLLYQCGLLPQIHQREILDKSKADGLAKALACLQAGWMVGQVIARLHAGLPVTLLEVNTLGHVFCAFVVYILWWNKPKWIKESTKIEGDWVKPIAAFMYMSSKISSESNLATGHVKDFVARSELSVLAYRPEDTKAGKDAHFVPKPYSTTGDLKPDTATSLELANLYASVQHPSHIQTERWRLAAQAVTTYPAIQARFTGGLDSQTRKDSEAVRLYPEMPANFLQGNQGRLDSKADWLECAAEELVTDVAANWPDDDLLRGVAGLMMGMVLWFASMAFGAVHAAAWDCYFPSEIEAWMWRVSALYITASGLIWLIANMLSQCSRVIWWYWYDMLLYQKHWLHYVWWITICAACGSVYVFARLFLVVEAFISLRSLPIGSYTTPQWTSMIPHL